MVESTEQWTETHDDDEVVGDVEITDFRAVKDMEPEQCVEALDQISGQLAEAGHKAMADNAKSLANSWESEEDDANFDNLRGEVKIVGDYCQFQMDGTLPPSEERFGVLEQVRDMPYNQSDAGLVGFRDAVESAIVTDAVADFKAAEGGSGAEMGQAVSDLVVTLDRLGGHEEVLQQVEGLSSRLKDVENFSDASDEDQAKVAALASYAEFVAEGTLPSEDNWSATKQMLLEIDGPSYDAHDMLQAMQRSDVRQAAFKLEGWDDMSGDEGAEAIREASAVLEQGNRWGMAEFGQDLAARLEEHGGLGEAPDDLRRDVELFRDYLRFENDGTLPPEERWDDTMDRMREDDVRNGGIYRMEIAMHQAERMEAVPA